eukprot:370931-Rhodomonas_salina.7
MHTIPREIEAELQRERQEWEEAEEMRKETGEVERGVCAGKSNDGGKKEQREEREEREVSISPCGCRDSCLLVSGRRLCCVGSGAPASTAATLRHPDI